MRKGLVLSIIFFATVSWAFAGGDEITPPGNTNTNTSSKADAVVIFNQGDNNSINTTSRQFAPAVPAGPTTYVIPGNAPSGKTEKRVVTLPEGVVTEEQIENGAKMTKNPVANVLIPTRWKSKQRIFPVVFRNGPRVKSNIVKVVDWNPYQFGYKEDVLLGAVTIVGEPWWPEMRFVTQGAKVCMRDMGAARVAMLRYEVVASKTETSVKGLSLGGASVNGSNDVALGSAIGYGKGTSTSYPETWPVYEMVCMNDGPNRRPPEQPKVAQAVPREPEKQKIEIEVNVPKIEVEVKHAEPELAPVSRTLAPKITAEPLRTEELVERCEGLPPFEVIFPYDKSIIRSQYLPKIREISDWLAGHPDCRVQIEGHASREGTYNYNAALGRRRSKAVYDEMVKYNGEAAARIEQFVSVSKDKPASDYLPANRRVIVRVVGRASGK